VTSEPVRALLDERARLLARPVAAAVTADVELVTFALASERYALESRYVVEVLRLADLALLPGAQPPVIGVTAWRGGLLTILDLRPLLGVANEALNDLGRVIVLGESHAVLGILADAVQDLIGVAASAIREPPQGVAVRREYLRGVTGEALLVLDAGKLLRLLE
jgi:purine-binding chemotaxis protein CheW